MSLFNHNVVKAHSFARLAEEELENKQWENAIQYHQQAADLFLMATNDTSDAESIKALQLLSSEQASKSKALLRYLQHFGAQRENALMNQTNSEPNRNQQSNIVQSETEPMYDISLAGSENFFVGQSPSSNSFDYTHYQKESKNEKRNSMTLDVWGWMERMLEMLTLPDQHKQTPVTRDPRANASLMNSFYVVPNADDDMIDSLMIDGGDHRPLSRQSSRDSFSKDHENQIKELQDKIRNLTEENFSLKKKMQLVYTERVQMARENNVMKENITNFRQELSKKAHLFRDISSSVGHLPSVLQSEDRPEQTTNVLKAEIHSLNNRITLLTQKISAQAIVIDNYEKELAKYKETLRKQTDLTSSLSSSGIPAPFEPDEFMTSSQILSNNYR